MEFSFWHALVKDVACTEVAKAERARIHAAVARWTAGKANGNLGEVAEIVVHHIDVALGLAPNSPGVDRELLDHYLLMVFSRQVSLRWVQTCRRRSRFSSASSSSQVAPIGETPCAADACARFVRHRGCPRSSASP